MLTLSKLYLCRTKCEFETVTDVGFETVTEFETEFEIICEYQLSDDI